MAVARSSSGRVTKSHGEGAVLGFFFPTDNALYSIGHKVGGWLTHRGRSLISTVFLVSTVFYRSPLLQLANAWMLPKKVKGIGGHTP